MAHRYGSEHKRLRRRFQREIDLGYGVLLPLLGADPPGTEWQLDHDADGQAYLGPAHKRCNLRAGGLARMRLLDGQSPKEKSSASRWSRQWYGPYDERCPACRERGGPCDDADEAA